jgi:tetratricopeptide (TPR) repeat protein
MTALAEALQHFQSGRLPEAETLCRQLVEREPDNATALHLLGVLAHQAGRNADAVLLIQRAIAQEPNNPEFHYNLGVALQLLDRFDEAAASYRESLRLHPGRAEAFNNLGHALLMRGRLEDALASVEQALRMRPDYAEAHHNRGEALRRLGRPADALADLLEAVRLRPDFVPAHVSLGRAFADQGRSEEAVSCFRQALQREPGHADAHNHLGLLFLRHGQLDAARDCFLQAVRGDPANPDAHNNLGAVLREQRQIDEAAACFERTLSLAPNHAGAHNNLGRVCEDRGRLEEAAARYRLALCLQPGNASFHNNLANVLTALGRPDEALACYRQAVQLQSAEPVFHSNLANTLMLAGRPEEAELCCRQALRLRPAFADACQNLAITLAAQGKFAEALAHNDEALRLEPEHPGARNCRALWWLQHGDFPRGWPEYEWRWEVRGVKRREFREPAWDGSPLAGRTILLYAEQALGDTLQFIRYAPLVQKRGGNVVVECQPPLARLLANCPGIDRLVPRGSPLPAFDVQAALLSLPGLFGTTLDRVPANVPYLFADPALVASWRQELRGTSFKVGIAWQGSMTFAGDRLRSAPLRHFAPLARVEGVRLFGLQKGTAREQIRDVSRQFTITDLGSTLDEGTGAFLDTAAVMMNLDLVVTTDTSIAHLAGALGVPVWVALSIGPDWRWLIGREDCPWYPSMRLFRQSRLHDWDEVFERMAAELRRTRASSSARNAVAIEISPGELIDRITTLELEADRLTDPAHLGNIRTELAALRKARSRVLLPSPQLKALAAELREVNETRGQIEDDLRLCERRQDFGPRFVELARSVFRTNDRRDELKREINGLLGPGPGAETSYTAGTAVPPEPPAPPRATVCILTFGDYLPYFRRCLDSVLRHTPAGRIELRLGFNAAPASLAYARQRLLLEMGEDNLVLPEGSSRTSFVSRGGLSVRLWDSPLNLYKEPMARRMFHDVPLDTEYTLWFDDDSFVEEGWWEALFPLFNRRVDYIGQSWWVDYLPGQEEMIRAQPWYRGMPFECRDGRPGVWFMTGGFLAVRSERLREANFPATEVAWKGDMLLQYGGDTLLGEIARQLNWTRASHSTHIQVNVDLEGKHPAPRRGGTGRQFGSAVDVAVG